MLAMRIQLAVKKLPGIVMERIQLGIRIQAYSGMVSGPLERLCSILFALGAT